MSIVEEELVVDMPSARQVPWEGLATEVDPNATPQEILQSAGLDWSVDKVRYTYNHNGKDHKSSRVALVRSTDSYEFTTITGKWEPVQNIEAFTFFDDLVKKGKMRMHAAGSLYNGKIVFALAQVKEPIYLFKEDRIDPYFLFTLLHEYGRATDLRFTPMRFECGNSLIMALRGKDAAIKLNHRKKLDPVSIKNALLLADQKLESYVAAGEYLGSRRALHDDVIGYLMKIFPSVSEKNAHEKLSRPAKTVLNILHKQPGANIREGSWWQVLNGVTFVIDHLLGRTKEGRIGTAWYGPNCVKKFNALTAAYEYAEKSGTL